MKSGIEILRRSLHFAISNFSIYLLFAAVLFVEIAIMRASDSGFESLMTKHVTPLGFIFLVIFFFFLVACLFGVICGAYTLLDHQDKTGETRSVLMVEPLLHKTGKIIRYAVFASALLSIHIIATRTQVNLTSSIMDANALAIIESILSIVIKNIMIACLSLMMPILVLTDLGVRASVYETLKSMLSNSYIWIFFVLLTSCVSIIINVIPITLLNNILSCLISPVYIIFTFIYYKMYMEDALERKPQENTL